MKSKFEVSKLAEALSRVNDSGAALLEDCMSRGAKDGEVADPDISGLTRAMADCWQIIAPREEATTGDTNPTLETEEKKLKGEPKSPTQEVAKDSRHVIHNVHDIFLSGESSQAPGYGIDAIFGGSRHTDDTSVAAPSLSAIFGGSPAKLAEG